MKNVKKFHASFLPVDEKEAYTYREIVGQPNLWKEVFRLVGAKEEEIRAFVGPVLKKKNLRIIMSGAGSSAFVGESVCGLIQKETGRVCQAIATTDLITEPSLFFLKDVPTLFVSFARSGNSPESLESVKVADQYCQNIFHLIICCNRSGSLIRNVEGKNKYAFILPKEANDKGLAMTGSFSSMLLSAILILRLTDIQKLDGSIDALQTSGNYLIRTYSDGLKKIAQKKYERVIFLGSGPLLGIARECQLKLQELTDGRVICKHDSFLGFRHGPRVVINENSLIVYLFSNDDYSFRYEKDLAESVAKGTPECDAICFGRSIPGLANIALDILFNDPISSFHPFYPLLAVMIGQFLGYYSSIAHKLNPDNPSVRGTINRVVQGVTIYST